MLVQLRQLKYNVILMTYSLSYNNNIFTHIILLLLTILQGIHLHRHVHFLNMIRYMTCTFKSIYGYTSAACCLIDNKGVDRTSMIITINII